MLAPGARAPDFALPDDTGSTIRLADLLARGPVVLSFYPADATPVCTKQACMMRDVLGQLAEAPITLVGISPQGSASKASFRAAHNLRQVLLADAGGVVARAYRATGMFGLPLPFGTRRTSYAISRQGVIEDAVHAELKLSRHEALIRRAIERARVSAR